MKPKEKAEELVKEMYKAHSNSASLITLYFAKQCALIAVDEIIKVAPIDKYENLQSELDVETVGLHLFEEYWQEVKQEIENIGGDE
jgi:hypothetical protein